MALGHAPDLVVVGAQREPEHIGDDLVAEPLLLQLPNEVEKDLVRRVGEGGADAAEVASCAMSTAV